MRLYLIYAAIISLCVYAWRDWFIPLCVLVVMTAVMKHADMPRSVFGIQGMNLWNLLLLFILIAWLHQRMNTPVRKPQTTRAMNGALIAYIAVIVIAFFRGFVDLNSIRGSNEGLPQHSPLGFVSDYLINPLKYVIAAYLLFDGARTRRNMLLALGAVFGQAGLYAIQVIKYIPPRSLLQPDNMALRERIVRECGLHANDMALVLVMTFWGLFASLVLWKYMKWWWRVAGVLGLMSTFIALALTQSRAGYIAFAGVALVFGIWRWRWLLGAMPIAAIAICLVFPSIPNRLLQGFGITTASGQQSRDLDTISAGRLTNLYPHVVTEISKSPAIGFGRLAILRTSVYDRILVSEGVVPTHPHNAYLEALLDGGVLGLIGVLYLFLGLPVMALPRFRSRDPLLIAAMGVGIAAAVTILLMGLSGQTFYPREGIFLVLCSYAIMLRAHIIDRELRAMKSSRSMRPG